MGLLAAVLVAAGLAALLASSGGAEAVAATSLSSGEDFSCAVTDEGAAQCWGASSLGQLGVGVDDGPDICGGGLSDEYPCSKSPVTVSGLGSGVQAVAAGADHACALMDDSTVKCWGRNDAGQLGSGGLGPDTCNDVFDRECSMTPVDVVGLTGVERLEAGSFHTCALVTGGGVKCWGDNGTGEIGPAATDTCHGNSCALTPVDTPFTSGVQDLATGGFHTCVIDEQGAAKCWGNNERGQVGSGVEGPDTCYVGRNIPCARTPTTVQGLSSGVTDITAGDSHSCALANGETLCWGDNLKYQISRDEPAGCNNINSHCYSTSPVEIFGATGDMIEAGSEHTCVSDGAGTLCWGLNNFGQLSGSTGPDDCPGGFKCSRFPAQQSGFSGEIVGLAPGDTHTCVLEAGGTVECWGDGFYGQLGTGDGEDSSSPVSPGGLEGETATPTASPTEAGSQLVFGDVNCTVAAPDIGDAIVIARFTIGLLSPRPLDCFDVGAAVLVNGVARVYGDVTCSGAADLGDAIILARTTIGLDPNQEPGCPEIGSEVTVAAAAAAGGP